jgi:hypothetical protein
MSARLVFIVGNGSGLERGLEQRKQKILVSVAGGSGGPAASLRFLLTAWSVHSVRSAKRGSKWPLSVSVWTGNGGVLPRLSAKYAAKVEIRIASGTLCRAIQQHIHFSESRW